MITTPRPVQLRAGVPYLAVPWTAVMVWHARITSSAGTLAFAIAATLTVAAWYYLLHRAWVGGPVALEVTTLLVMALSGLLLFGLHTYPMLMDLGFRLTAFIIGSDDPGLGSASVPPLVWWTAVTANTLALTTAITLRNTHVRAWTTRT